MRANWRALSNFGLLVVVATLGLTPLDGDDLWWELSRGRCVFDGSLAPSQQLLIAEMHQEANWLGGVPLYVVWQVSDVRGLMLLKLLAATGFAYGCLRAVGSLALLRPLSIVGCLVVGLATRDAIEPGGRLLDLLGLLSLSICLPFTTRRSRVVGLCTLLLWANSGQFVALGLILWLASWTAQFRRKWKWMIGGLFVCCLTPRGVFTVWDSVRFLCPVGFADVRWLRPFEDLAPVLLSGWCVSTIAFCFVTIACLFTAFGCRPTHAILVIVTLFLGWSSRGAMPLCAVTAVILSIAAASENSSFRSKIERLASMSTTRALSLAAVVVICFGCNYWTDTDHSTRMGWGASPRIDVNALRESLTQIHFEGSAYTDNALSTGMVAWLYADQKLAYDHPNRVFLRGDLREHVLLREDLLASRAYSYRREDGSIGGWWKVLEDRSTSLLLISEENREVVRSICEDDENLWRPIAIASAAIPFAKANNPRAADAIITTYRFQHFLDWQAGQSNPPATSGSDSHTDLWGIISGSADASDTIRQARLLRMMGHAPAALRLLLPAREATNRGVWRSEFQSCQKQLVFWEWQTFGHTSLLRQTASTDEADNDLAIIKNYRRGRPPSHEVDDDVSDEELYAQAWLLLEWGSTQEAQSAFRTLADRPDSGRLGRMTGWIEKQIRQ